MVTWHGGAGPQERPAHRRSQETVREHNLALVLRLVADRPGTSRAQLATATGLTRSTVSSLVDTLAAWGLVTDAGRAAVREPRPGAGRPATALTLAAGGAAGLGIEINVDYVAACVVDLTGHVRWREVDVADRRAGTPADAVASAAALAGAAAARADEAGLRVVGACLALPGLVRPATGELVLAPNLGWHEVDVLALLRRHDALAALPVTLDNEANCAALAELSSRGSSARPSFLYVSGEVGVGGALVVDGAVLRGSNGWSGELGHMTVRPDGPACGCGGRGCLEQYAGQEAILRAAGMVGEATTSLAPVPSVDRIVELAREGTPRLTTALRDAGRALGVVLASAVNLLDLTEVVLGGSFRPLVPWLRPEVVRELDLRVLSRGWSDLTVRAAARSTDAAVVGAASTVVRAVVDDPAGWAPAAPAARGARAR